MLVHVFIVGSKGIPAKYGGFETFVENLTLRKQTDKIQYHVSCMNNEEKVFVHNNAECFGVKVPGKGASGRIFHVGKVLWKVEKWCKDHQNKKIIVYILGCRIGPLIIPYYYRLHELGVKIICNPDGLEWKRDKWNIIEKRFLRYCESCLVRYSDLSICDSLSIMKYINEKYPGQKTEYIAYGANIERSTISENELNVWYQEHKIRKNEYYLIVGRFVPENNYEKIINEFMRSSTKKELVIITNIEKNKLYKDLIEKTRYYEDKRIKFVGTIYNQDLLKKIRENAFGYIHGHEVGGTNPSLLEALASTRLNLLLDVGFNKEVGGDSALYWNKDKGMLCTLINEIEQFDSETIKEYDQKSTGRIKELYTWEKICKEYESIFLAQ